MRLWWRLASPHKQVVLTLKYNYHASVIVNFLLYIYLGAKEVGTYHI